MSLCRVATGDPALSVKRGAAAGDQRVDVGMVVQPLVSRVEHELRRSLEQPGLTQRFVE